jgi:hypothetical protein
MFPIRDAGENREMRFSPVLLIFETRQGGLLITGFQRQQPCPVTWSSRWCRGGAEPCSSRGSYLSIVARRGLEPRTSAVKALSAAPAISPNLTWMSAAAGDM